MDDDYTGAWISLLEKASSLLTQGQFEKWLYGVGQGTYEERCRVGLSFLEILTGWNASRTQQEVEAEIERRGLQEAYVKELIDVCELDAQVFSSAIECNPHVSSDGPTVLWKLIRATPEQCCRAALKAVGL